MMQPSFFEHRSVYYKQHKAGFYSAFSYAFIGLFAMMPGVIVDVVSSSSSSSSRSRRRRRRRRRRRSSGVRCLLFVYAMAYMLKTFVWLGHLLSPCVLDVGCY